MKLRFPCVALHPRTPRRAHARIHASLSPLERRPCWRTPRRVLVDLPDRATREAILGVDGRRAVGTRRGRPLLSSGDPWRDDGEPREPRRELHGGRAAAEGYSGRTSRCATRSCAAHELAASRRGDDADAGAADKPRGGRGRGRHTRTGDEAGRHVAGGEGEAFLRPVSREDLRSSCASSRRPSRAGGARRVRLERRVRRDRRKKKRPNSDVPLTSAVAQEGAAAARARAPPPPRPRPFSPCRQNVSFSAAALSRGPSERGGAIPPTRLSSSDRHRSRAARIGGHHVRAARPGGGGRGRQFFFPVTQ